MDKKVKVIMLPTKKTDGIMIWKYPNLPELRYTAHKELKKEIPQHLYLIPSYEEIEKDPSINEIKEGDWYINLISCNLIQAQEDFLTDLAREAHIKVIASTDLELGLTQEQYLHIYPGGKIEDKWVENKRLPQIPESFIKAYVEANGIDEVMVEYDFEPIWEEVYAKNEPNCWKEWKGIKPTVPKLTDNNEVVIHLEKDKILTPKEAVLAYREYAWVNGLTVLDAEKWIKENLYE